LGFAIFGSCSNSGGRVGVGVGVGCKQAKRGKDKVQSAYVYAKCKVKKKTGDAVAVRCLQCAMSTEHTNSDTEHRSI
jgi:hypothetical protein